MRKPAVLMLLLAAIGGGYFFLSKYKIEGLEGLKVAPRTTDVSSTNPHGSPPIPNLPVKRTGETIRIASFNIQVFGESKANKPQVMDALAKICRNFDIIAVQEIRSQTQDSIPKLVDAINAAGRHYDYVVGPRLGRTSSKEQYAFIFDRESVEVDRAQVYTMDDPGDVLHREPLVGWFRVRGPAPDQAFTFSLVNIHTDPDEVQEELKVLDRVFTSVRGDGRGEDDVILVGDFNADDRHLGPVMLLPDMVAAIHGVTSNTRGTQLYDNIIFQAEATSEFAGRAGVFDFMRQYNMPLEAALEVSDHLPVWAEFSVYEDMRNSNVAARPIPLAK